MTPDQASQKETTFLLNKHNKTTPYKIKQFSFIFPNDILAILCQKEKRSPEQEVRIKTFRKECMMLLSEQSKILKDQQLKKAHETREKNLAKDRRYVKHFGRWINQTLPSSKLSRDNYAIINSKPSIGIFDPDPSICTFCDPQNPTSLRYTPQHCLKLQTRALENFDINISRFDSLNYENFSRFLISYTRKRHFQEIFDLDDDIVASNIKNAPSDYDYEGYVYIMVLDEYKQVYIGITRTSVKQRILEHWNAKVPLDRLVFGVVENSKLSINSFGPLDTTRIFALKYFCKSWPQLEQYESRCIRAFDKRYILNRL